MSARPCLHPGCSDQFGDPRITGEGMCPRCREQLRRTLALIERDYERLAQMPREQGPDTLGRTATPTSYGHPAAWASDLCREIAGTLTGAHGLLAQVLGGPGPAPRLAQAAKVKQSRKWLADRLDDIAVLDYARDLAQALADLRSLTRPRGEGRPMRWLGAKCPECANLTLWRVWDELEEHYDQVVCTECRWEPDEDTIGEWAARYQREAS